MKKLLKNLFCAGLMAVSGLAFAAKKSIVCVTYPEYDWVMNILGNKASKFKVSLLQNNGSDLHSYQPSVKDIAKIATCDMLVYVGGESDEWVEKALANATNKNMTVVNLVESLGDKVKEEEVVEGMEHHHDHDAHGHDHDDHDHDAHGHDDHDHDHDAHGHDDHDDHDHDDHDHDAHGHDHDDHDHDAHEHEHDHEHEKDEHVWLSLKFAAELTNVLSEKIQKLDSANASLYKANTAAYVKELSDLDALYEKTVASSSKKTLLFGDRFPFRYLADDYKLTYFAAFTGCSAESEASFETVVFLAKKIDDLGLNSILTIEKSDKKIARTIISNTKNKNQQVLEMDSLQSVTEKDIKSGRNYLSAMKNNLEVLKSALK